MTKIKMNTVTLTINGNKVDLHTHDGENFIELYRAQDLMKAAGLEGKAAKQKLQDWLRSQGYEISLPLNIIKVVGKGKTQGTYLTKRDLFKLAAYIDPEFHDAVFEAFELLVSGQLYAASDKAYGFAIPAELKGRIKAATSALNDAVRVWNNRPDREHKWDDQFAYQYFGKAVCQVATGGSIESLTRGTNFKSLCDYFIKSGHIAGAEAYIATCTLYANVLKAGLPYQTCNQIVGYHPAVKK